MHRFTNDSRAGSLVTYLWRNGRLYVFFIWPFFFFKYVQNEVTSTDCSNDFKILMLHFGSCTFVFEIKFTINLICHLGIILCLKYWIFVYCPLWRAVGEEMTCWTLTFWSCTDVCWETVSVHVVCNDSFEIWGKIFFHLSDCF